MLKVICDKCGKEKVVDAELSGFTTISCWRNDVPQGETEERQVGFEVHCCDECMVKVSERNEKYKASVDRVAKKQDKIVVPATNKFKEAQKKLSEEMNRWVVGYFGK